MSYFSTLETKGERCRPDLKKKGRSPRKFSAFGSTSILYLCDGLVTVVSTTKCFTGHGVRYIGTFSKKVLFKEGRLY